MMEHSGGCRSIVVAVGTQWWLQKHTGGWIYTALDAETQRWTVAAEGPVYTAQKHSGGCRNVMVDAEAQ
jgi:hypothetical protein